MSFFEELKRRNVVRVGIAYVVAAWVMLQIFDVLGEILELPEWGGKLILAIIVIGFFLALFFAWAFELTPEGIKREHEVDRSQSITHVTGKKLNNTILVLMAVAIAYLLFDKFYLSPQLNAAKEQQTGQVAAEKATAPPPPAAVPAVNPHSIAVLPFDNRSRLQEDEFFVEGIHDDLLTNLARIGSLKVISRTSVSRYRETQKSIPEIAGELGVATVMEGAVQRSGNTVRINVQLIDAKTDEHLWAEIFDRELTAENLFAIQSEISAEIAKALQATLSPQEQQRLNERPTDNLAAYNAYLRGRQLMARRNSEDMDQAAKEFQRAVELDRQFALAWVGISETAALQITYSTLSVKESIERQQEAVSRALALDDQLGEAHLGQAELHATFNRPDEAEAAYRKAIALSPGYASAYQWYALFLNSRPSRLAEALELLQKAAELDPLSSIIQLNTASLYRTLGRFEESERRFDRLLQQDPDFAPAFSSRADLASSLGRMDERIQWLNRSIEMDPGRLQNYFPLLWAQLDIGNPEAIADIKRRMAELNDQHATLGLADMFSNVYASNYAGALEAANWTLEKLGGLPWFMRIFGLIHNMNRDYQAAREAWEVAEPRLFRPGEWRAAIEESPEDACFVGWMMQRTGDSEMGTDLIRTSLDYLENELSNYIDHADRYWPEACYVATGEIEKALRAVELRVAHKHYANWWFIRKHPQFEPLWGEPRFEAAMQKIQDDIAIQRANLERVQAAL